MYIKQKGTYFIQLIAVIAIILQSSCETRTPKDLTKENIIPKPVSITATGSSFIVNADTKIYFDESSRELERNGQFLADYLNEAGSLSLGTESVSEAPQAGIYLSASANNDQLGDEGYNLEITEDLITMSANNPQGVFRGLQTIRQLLPAAKGSATLEIATGTISDFPTYSYRGSMLDVARHFFDVSDVKRYIDFLTFYKMNVLHLHLTDDQGWRIEIKSWPKLAEYGGLTEVGGGKGGFFTQDDYIEIVKYAADRHIIIIPEIDMPGHTQAALASYPELTCDGQAHLVASLKEMSSDYPGLYTGTEVGFSTLCTSQEATYKIINDVVRELAAITPGPYIHIGGDESHVTKKEDYIPFIERVQTIVKSHGKNMIGWDETAQSALQPGGVVQLWHNEEFAKEAVSKGAKLIMAPAKKAYLDMSYDSTSRIGYHWAAYIEVDEGYNWDPSTYLSGINKDDIIGLEAPLWGETITNMDDIEYLTFPRLPGYAEIGWTPLENRNWDEYKLRLAAHGKRFEAMDIDYYPSARVPWDSVK